jgi:sulfoxide reductase heme-binding subunit YedZ
MTSSDQIAPRRFAKTGSWVPWTKVAIHALCLLPLLSLSLDAVRYELGADPVAEITHRTGIWTLRLLLITLSVTPLRRLTKLAVLVRFRRLLGLYAFCYACLHLSTYLVLDLRGYWPQIAEDVVKRPFMTVGFIAWLLLVPLALTSTQGMMRRLGRNWQRLHQLIYLIGLLGVLHFMWLVKSGQKIARQEPLLYLGILVVLLLARVDWRRLARKM